MTDYLDKISVSAARNVEGDFPPSLKGLITGEFGKITHEFKDFKKDMQNIDIRLTTT